MFFSLMKCRGVETPRKDKGRRKAALGTELGLYLAAYRMLLSSSNSGQGDAEP